jgi:exopolysaccharide production protein ExoZ
MLISVQYARALAALLVVYAHLRGFAVFGPLDGGEFGDMGVDIFFVISGFIMWETSGGQSPADFARRRLSRIVPPYWFYTTLLVLLAWALPRLTPNVTVDAPAIFGSFFFIPYVNHNGLTNPILLQGWTLNYEMFFYVIFGLSLFIASRAVQFWSLAGFFVGCAVVGILYQPDVTAITFYTSTMPLEFVLGIVVSMASKIQARFGVSATALLIGLAGLLYGEVYSSADVPRFVALGLPAAFTLFGLVGLEGLIRRRPIGWLARIGDASYSLYLLHPFILSAAAVAMKLLAARLPAFAGMAGAVTFAIIGIVASAICAHLSFIALEKPMGRYFNALLSGRGRRRELPIAADSVKDSV